MSLEDFPMKSDLNYNIFLPKISEAIEIHKIFVSALLTSWRTTKSKNAIKVPIS